MWRINNFYLILIKILYYNQKRYNLQVSDLIGYKQLPKVITFDGENKPKKERIFFLPMLTFHS